MGWFGWGDDDEAAKKETADGTSPPPSGVSPVVHEGNDEATQNRERLNYQCYLLSRMGQIAKHDTTRGGYTGFTCVDGDPTDIIHRLTAGKGRSGFLDIDAAQFGLLVPRIKIFKVPLKQNGDPQDSIGKEITFKTHYSESIIEQLTSNKRSRGDGTGLKSLSYEFYDAGSTQLASRRQKITLKFYGESLAALSEGGALSLAMPSEKTVSEYEGGKLVPGTEKPNSEYYALKLVYGWAIPPEKEGFIGPALVRALRASTQTLVLSLTDHTLTFAENGSVELECTYEAYADTKLNELNNNILWTDTTQAEQIKRAEDGVRLDKNIKAQADGSVEKEELKDKKNNKWVDSDELDDAQTEQDRAGERLEKSQAALDKLKATDKATKYRRLLDELAESNQIWAIMVSAEDLGILGRGFWGDKKVQKFSCAAATKEQEKNMSAEEIEENDKCRASLNAAKDPVSIKKASGGDSKISETLENSENIIGDDPDQKEDLANAMSANNLVDEPTPAGLYELRYMYFGDILAAVLKNAYNGKQMPIQYLVGPLNFKDPVTGKWNQINIADIPVSMNLFEQFWAKNVIKPSRDTYTIKQFIRQAIDELIVAALGDDCFPGAGKANTSPTAVKMTTLSSPALQDGKSRIRKGGRVGPSEIPVAAGSYDTETTTPRKHLNYLLIYSSAWTSKDLSGDRGKDAARGIYHFAVGQDRGPIKRVSFEKMDIEFQQTAAAMRGGSTLDRLAAAYKVKLTMIGNTLLMPGNHVYVAPTSMGMGTATAQKLGLGGYYVVTKLNGTVDSAGWTAEVEGTPIFSSAEDRTHGARSAPSPAPSETPSAPNPEEEPK